MKLSLEKLQEYSEATGFRIQALEKVIRLAELLADIGRHPLLSRLLALKGGAALNLCFAAPQRLSVDLDFNYVGSPERERMLVERPELERAIDTIATARGYQVQKSALSHAGRKLYLQYRGKTGTRERIELDLNFLFRVPLGDLEELPMWLPGDLERPQARLVPFEELAAGKLCALLERMTPRDLFDTTRLPKYRPEQWKSQRCRRIFVALAGALKHPLGSYGRDRLERVTDRQIEEQLDPMLVPNARLKAQELRQRAWAVAAPLLALDDAEREYIERIQRGEIRGELLFPGDDEMVERLRRHPAVRWRVDNIRRFRARET